MTTSSKPELYVFAISHYCEKARFALDYMKVAYELRHLAPGSHIEVAKKLGVPGTSVPILVADGEVVQGSAQIIDWLDAHVADASNRLTPETQREECLALEQRFDDVAGVHVRRFYYSEALVEYPETVEPIFTRDLEEPEKTQIREAWPIVRQLMMGAMDLGAEQGRESKRIVEGELDWLDGMLADGREHLVGDRLSRADIAAAALLAPLAQPKEHPAYGALEMPPNLSADLERWEGRPFVKWVRDIYTRYR